MGHSLGGMGPAIVTLALATALGGCSSPASEPPKGGQGSSEPARALYLQQCAACHGESGKGETWRAKTFLIKPGDLTDRAHMQTLTDRYLFDIIKHGGANFGKPGMPGVGFTLTDQQVLELVSYVRTLSTSTGGV